MFKISSSCALFDFIKDNVLIRGIFLEGFGITLLIGFKPDDFKSSSVIRYLFSDSIKINFSSSSSSSSSSGVKFIYL